MHKAQRFGRRLSLLCVDLEGFDPARDRHAMPALVAAFRRTLRTTDVLIAEEGRRFWVLVTDTDSLGGVVLKRRIAQRLRDVLGEARLDAKPALGVANFPADGESLEALAAAAQRRVQEEHSSVVHDLGIEPETPLSAIGARLLDRARWLPRDFAGEAAELLIGDLVCRPRDRGLLFLAPGSGAAALPRAARRARRHRDRDRGVRRDRRRHDSLGPGRDRALAAAERLRRHVVDRALRRGPAVRAGRGQAARRRSAARLPLERPGADRAHDLPAARRDRLRSARLSMRLLIADHDRGRAKAVSEACTGRGHVVELAPHGASALELALERVPEVVICPIDLAVIDGVRLAEILRGNPRTRSVSFVFLVNDELDAPISMDSRDATVVAPWHEADVLDHLDLILERSARFGEIRSDKEIEGKLAQIPVADLLQILQVNQRSGSVRIAQDGMPASATISIRGGQVIDAMIPLVDGTAVVGEKALYRTLGWKEGRFEFIPGDMREPARITKPLRMLLLEGVRQKDEWDKLRRDMPGPELRLELRVPREQIPRSATRSRAR